MPQKKKSAVRDSNPLSETPKPTGFMAQSDKVKSVYKFMQNEVDKRYVRSTGRENYRGKNKSSESGDM
tara:strand:+ start:3135 stop:3338 length:204 start_codon:yes stop_codon:yes gene_type:complete